MANEKIPPLTLAHIRGRLRLRLILRLRRKTVHTAAVQTTIRSPFGVSSANGDLMIDPHKFGVHKVLKHIPLGAVFDAPYKRAVRKAVNIADLRSIAKSRTHKIIFDYIDSGADDEITLRRNKDAYSEHEMHYKVLSGIKPPLDLSTKIFGMDIDMPFFGCPTAANRIFHHEGEVGVAKAAAKFGTLYGLSTHATSGFEDVSKVHTGPKIFQMYLWNDKELVRDLIAKARENGFSALALTVDFSWYGNRERDLRNEFTIPLQHTPAHVMQALARPAWTYDFLANDPCVYACINADVPAQDLYEFVDNKIAPDFTWADAEWLLGEWNGPAATKGVVRPEDAKKAIDTGFSTVWVSNHGGRQMETAPATIDVLPSIREAVGPDAEVILDGGIQRGTDIAKALALGADAVGVGKPYLYGLAAGGEEGVCKAFDILKVELDRAMGLLGTPTVEALKREGPNLIKRRHGSARDYPDRYAFERGYGGGVI